MTPNTTESETCRYCDRVKWGQIVPLPNNQWRHQSCAPGSTSWCEWYDLHPERHSVAGDILRATELL